MNWSLGEAAALAVKAARGAGLPWGLADEAGFALRWLEARGLPGAEALALYLPKLEAADTHAFLEGRAGGPLCPLRLGAALLDFGGEVIPVWYPGLRQPILLTPFLGRMLGGALEWKDARVVLSGEGVTATGAGLLAAKADCRFARGGTAPAGAAAATRVPSSAAAHMGVLAGLAARTYAPATAASRTSGAGAEVDDND